MGGIGVGITTYGGGLRLRWLLKSIALRPPYPDEIVVVDDGSPLVQMTRDAVEEFVGKLPVTLIEHGQNRGISAGWNTATRATKADAVILINDDVIVSSGWMEPLAYVLEHSPLVGAVGQSWHAFLGDDVDKLLESEHSDEAVIPRDPMSKAPVPERRTLYEDTHPGRVMAPTGQLFGFRRSDFDAIGGFDENYKSFYEESCFSTSMAKMGKIGLQTTWPFCWHMWSATFGASPELQASQRLAHSRAHYRAKWAVPEGVGEFDYTNPKYLGAIGDVEVAFLRKAGPARGVLRQDGAFLPVP